MKEANIVKKFKDKLSGHWTMIENTVSSGVPDTMASRNGHMCWIEFKRLYNRDIILRPLQITWMIRELRHNGRICVAWWDQGPVVLIAEHLIKMDSKQKGGKLYYDVVDHPCCIHGWDNIDNYLFKD